MTVEDSLLIRLEAQAALDGIQQHVVGAVVCEAGKVLLLKRPNEDFMGGIYELPSGKVEPGETLVEALVREVKEETGLQVGELNHYLGSFDYTSGSGKSRRQHNFSVSVAQFRPVVLEEHVDYQWLEVGTASHGQVTGEVQAVLSRFQSLANRPE